MGYVGYSMSENARDAYEYGEKPLSKWTKSEILDQIEPYATTEQFEVIRKTKLSILKDVFLTKTAWHHTSKFYNETNFYMVEFTEDRFNDLKNYQPIEKQVISVRKAKCKFLTWGGTRNHPKAYEHEEIGEIKGNWFYSSIGKKSIHANGFKILEEF